MDKNESENSGQDPKPEEKPKPRLKYRLIKGGGTPPVIRRYPQRRNSQPIKSNSPEEPPK